MICLIAADGSTVDTILNTLVSGCFWGFLQKYNRITHGFAHVTRASKVVESCSTSKAQKMRQVFWTALEKKFLVAGAYFFEWRHMWRACRPPWPTLPGPGLKLLGGSVLLKFLLETRLQFESSDTLDDLLRFQVQKLWSKTIKIFD